MIIKVELLFVSSLLLVKLDCVILISIVWSGQNKIKDFFKYDHFCLLLMMGVGEVGALN